MVSREAPTSLKIDGALVGREVPRASGYQVCLLAQVVAVSMWPTCLNIPYTDVCKCKEGFVMGDGSECEICRSGTKGLNGKIISNVAGLSDIDDTWS